ncbi:hypothetical protein [Pantoea sp. B65]|uniref:hypothetical protein n=1 Tax=Pantoea sp. B65 TaxID=2813359 RepID=UPI0039B5DC71
MADLPPGLDTIGSPYIAVMNFPVGLKVRSDTKLPIERLTAASEKREYRCPDTDAARLSYLYVPLCIFRKNESD